MNTVIEIGIPVSPSKSITLESLGKRNKIFCNTHGGLGGGCLTLIANVIESNDKFMALHLTESNRKMNVYHNWISCIEDVELYKQTNVHENPNFKNTSPIIEYWLTLGGAKLKQKKVHSERTRHDLLQAVEYRFC